MNIREHTVSAGNSSYISGQCHCCPNTQQRRALTKGEADLDSYGDVITYSQHLTQLIKMLLWKEDNESIHFTFICEYVSFRV